MQSVSSRIWTRVVVSISYDDNYYTTGNSSKYMYIVIHKQTVSLYYNSSVWLGTLQIGIETRLTLR